MKIVIMKYVASYSERALIPHVFVQTAKHLFLVTNNSSFL